LTTFTSAPMAAANSTSTQRSRPRTERRSRSLPTVWRFLRKGRPIFQLKENVTLTSNHPDYSWVNPIQVWAPGTVDVSKGEIRIKGYAV
jgi:hypothetical protein